MTTAMARAELSAMLQDRGLFTLDDFQADVCRFSVR
jgi:hypothetical protein